LNVVYLVVGVAIVGVQRLLELTYSRRNEVRLRARGAVERGSGHYPVIVAIHTLWLVSTLVEGLLRGPEPPVWWPVPAVAVLGDPISGRELEHKGTRSAWRKTGQEGTIPLLPSSQLRRRRRGGPDLPAHLRRLDNSDRLLATERSLALRPHPDGEPSTARVGELELGLSALQLVSTHAVKSRRKHHSRGELMGRAIRSRAQVNNRDADKRRPKADAC
jgi:hypothetical protein